MLDTVRDGFVDREYERVLRRWLEVCSQQPLPQRLTKIEEDTGVSRNARAEVLDASRMPSSAQAETG